jgi:hypothetical protein
VCHTGITSVDVLVVAGGGAGGTHHGGGGGAGGLIFVPGFPVTPGGTVSVTVGCGGGQPNNYPAPDNTLVVKLVHQDKIQYLEH